MGRRQHHCRGWQLGVGQVDNLAGDREEAQPALGCHSVNGMLTHVYFSKGTEDIQANPNARIRSTRHSPPNNRNWHLPMSMILTRPRYLIPDFQAAEPFR
jgi:hypothetical protein